MRTKGFSTPSPPSTSPPRPPPPPTPLPWPPPHLRRSRRRRVLPSGSERCGAAAPPLLPLATLIGRELRGGDRSERPAVRYGHAAFAKRGEDYFLVKPDCLRVPGNPSSSFSVFAVSHSPPLSIPSPFVAFDLYLLSNLLLLVLILSDLRWANGVSAAVFTKEHLLDHVLSAIPQGISREEWLQALPRALVAGFVKTDIDFQRKGEIDRRYGCGEFIVPIPHVKQVKLSSAGGRLIIASDGIWDALSSEMAAKACRGLPAEIAAKLVVKEALRTSGLKDDTTCLVVDIIPSDHSVLPSSPKKNQNKLRSLLFGRRSQNTVGKLMNRPASVGAVEELFEEGSAMLEERLGKNFPTKANSAPFRCAICQMDQSPSEDLPADSGTFFSPTSKPWEGPYLCSDCRRKKDAMEGKRPSRATVLSR
uniref:protein-serine/threonine phosphatase n=1 Tax=Ananas comosus var. bracteatus TaxID=296719 RepID=A0A6V7QAI8_ANACO|nr:unnamed protein product [Ananas comosus var. bracteatus]